MARVPTVTVWDKKKKRLLTFNANEYALRNLISTRYEIRTMARGDATNEEVMQSLKEAKKEQARRNNPDHDAFKDRERA